MNIEKVQELIGKPYDAAKFNCWHLVMLLVPEAPSVDVVATKSIGMHYFNDDSYYNGFQIVENPEDGDIVLMGRDGETLHHAGVMVLGKVIHARTPSVVVHTLTRLRSEYKEVRFYRAIN